MPYTTSHLLPFAMMRFVWLFYFVFLLVVTVCCSCLSQVFGCGACAGSYALVNIGFVDTLLCYIDDGG